MLWLLLLLQNSCSRVVGPLDWTFDFVCGACGGRVAAVVRATGQGSASDAWTAERNAFQSAEFNAGRALFAAGCPHCGQLHPTIQAQLAAASRRGARRVAIRLPAAIAVGVLVLCAAAVPAVRDLGQSAWLTVAALAAAGAAFAAVFGLMSWPVASPVSHPWGVWFSFDAAQGPASWFAARPGPAPRVSAPAAASRWVPLGAAGGAGLAALVALFLWSETFRKVHVISAEGARGALSVAIDGAPVGTVDPVAPAHLDAPYASFEVRTGTTHQLTITDAAGALHRYELDPTTASHGWVVAPRGRERGLCLASITTYYGQKPPAEGDDAILNDDLSDLVVLPRSFSNVLEPSPASVQVSNGGSATRSALRALTCAGIRKEQSIPFKDGTLGDANE